MDMHRQTYTNFWNISFPALSPMVFSFRFNMSEMYSFWSLYLLYSYQSCWWLWLTDTEIPSTMSRDIWVKLYETQAVIFLDMLRSDFFLNSIKKLDDYLMIKCFY